MFSPVKWIRPRLKPFCIGFGAADMTLVLISIMGWYFFFDLTFFAQHNPKLLEQQKLIRAKKGVSESHTHEHILFKPKEDRTSDELRVERTNRACGYDISDEFFIDEDFTSSASLIGASMGCYFILGALLASLSVVEWHAGLKVLCFVCLFGEGISTFFLLIAVVMLFANEGLCPTEYFYEYFQPLLCLYSLTLIFLFCYKTYEMTVITLYLADETKKVKKEKFEDKAKKRASLPAGPHHNIIQVMATAKPETRDAGVQVKLDTVRPSRRSGSQDGDDYDRKRPVTPKRRPKTSRRTREDRPTTADRESQYRSKKERCNKSCGKIAKGQSKQSTAAETEPLVASKGAQSTRRRRRERTTDMESQYETYSEESSRPSSARKTKKRKKRSKAVDASSAPAPSTEPPKPIESKIIAPCIKESKATHPPPAPPSKSSTTTAPSTEQPKPKESKIIAPCVKESKATHPPPAPPSKSSTGICICEMLSRGNLTPRDSECCQNTDSDSCQDIRYSVNVQVNCKDSRIKVQQKCKEQDNERAREDE